MRYLHSELELIRQITPLEKRHVDSEDACPDKNTYLFNVPLVATSISWIRFVEFLCAFVISVRLVRAYVCVCIYTHVSGREGEEKNTGRIAFHFADKGSHEKKSVTW